MIVTYDCLNIFIIQATGSDLVLMMPFIFVTKDAKSIMAVGRFWQCSLNILLLQIVTFSRM